MDTLLIENYFNWLAADAFEEEGARRRFHGVLKVLHDIPFYWTLVSDDNRVGDAIGFRDHEFLPSQYGIQDMDPDILQRWAAASPSVLEVLLGCCRRWGFYFEAPTSFFFNDLFRNLDLHRFPGVELHPERAEKVRYICDTWMARTFEPNGHLSPFPIKQPNADQRTVDIWGQMNAYSLEHYQ